MHSERDPTIRAAVVNLGFAAPEPPPLEAVAALASSPSGMRFASRWRVAAASVVVVLLVIGAPLWLVFRGGTAPVTDAIPPATPILPAPTSIFVPQSTTTLPGGFEVVIESEILFGWDEENVWEHGAFAAQGPAVDAGLMCPEGTINLASYNKSFGTWRVEVKHVCADGSGSFHLAFDLAASYSGGTYTETGTWVVVYGTDTYADLVGSGSDSTISPSPNRYLAVQVGQVAIDDGADP